MKSIYLIFILALAAISLANCQTRSTAVSNPCQPVSNPFPTPSATRDWIEYAPNVTIGRVCNFSGEVTRGQTYTHEIEAGLVFCLRPNSFWKKDGGWDIVISDTSENNCGKSFSSIVTPPFYGDNPIFIQGWQFRNENNTREVPESVNAARKTRLFNFVFNQNDYELIWKAHDCIMRNQCIDGLTQDKATNTIETTPKSRGVVTITNLVLGNLVPNDAAWIEQMEFNVKIYLPAE